MDGRRLAAYAAEHAIDVLKITPSHLRALLAADDRACFRGGVLVLGGEALSWELVARIATAGAGCRDPQPLRPDRDHRRLLHLRGRRGPPRADRPAVPIGAAAPRRPRLRARRAARARAGRGAGRALRRRRRRRARLRRRPDRDRRAVRRRIPATRRRASTAPATACASCATTRSSSSAASITRSRSAATASSRARSRPRSPAIRRSARPPSSGRATADGDPRLVAYFVAASEPVGRRAAGVPRRVAAGLHGAVAFVPIERASR